MRLQRDIPFDQYTRQRIVSDAINSLREKNEKFAILDVGGYKGNTEKFLPKDNLTVADIADVDEKDYIKTSALDMPFDDNEYDFVVSFDVLEHINSNDRKRFVNECLRVAKRGVIICAPHQTVKNKAAENNLNHLYKTISGSQHQWLREHIENGLPEFDEVIKVAKQKKFHTKSVFSNDIGLWMLMQGALFTNEKYPNVANKLIALNDQYNTQLTTDLQVDESEAYRQIFFAIRKKSDMDKVDAYINLQMITDQRQQKIDITYKILDYYVALVEEIDGRYGQENEALKNELENVNNRLNVIEKSKAWRYSRKVSAIKSVFTKR